MDHPLTLEEVIAFLLQTPLFEDLDPAELAEIVQIMQVQRLRDGQIVFEENADGDAWFVIFRGTCVVTKDVGDNTPRVIALLDPRSCVGEMAVLDGSRRSATVSARGEATLFKFRRTDFEDLLETGSFAAYKLVLAMARVLCERQRNLTQKLSELRNLAAARSEEALPTPVQEMVDSYTVSE